MDHPKLSRSTEARTSKELRSAWCIVAADALELRDVADPVIGEDDVLRRVHAAGCGPDVWHLMTGLPYFARLFPQVRKARGHPRGRDVAGVVEGVGARVSGLHAGDEVMGIVEGSFAELAAGNPELLVRKPAGISFEQAAAVPISGLAALGVVRDVANVRSGQSVLVIDYTRQDFADGTRVWDVIVDTAGLRPLRTLRRALAPRGTLPIVGGDGGGKVTAVSSARSSGRRCCPCSSASGCGR